jgi:amino acid adenylation domain-containing protein
LIIKQIRATHPKAVLGVLDNTIACRHTHRLTFSTSNFKVTLGVASFALGLHRKSASVCSYLPIATFVNLGRRMTYVGEIVQLPLDYGGPRDRPFEPFIDAVLEGSIIDRFEAIARRFACRLATQDSRVSLTYADLAALVERIATATLAATDDRPGPVALLLPADVQFPAAMLGVLASGRAYIPLDANFPIERNRLIASQSGACAVVSSGDLVVDARNLFSDTPIIDLMALPEPAPMPPRLASRPDDVASIFFTSGSTGLPKGIAVSHCSLLQRAQQPTNATHISAVDRVLLLSSPSVALGGHCILYTLLNGASLHISRPQERDLRSLARLIRDRGITYYVSVPTLMRRIVECLDPGERLDSVRLVYLGGERIEWTDLEACRRTFARDVLLYACFASTECGTYLHWFMDRALTDPPMQPPAGRPATANVTIIADDGTPVADGEVGEIVVAGRSIACGYWQDLEIRAFPSDRADPKRRLFQTGDLGRRRPGGLIEFLGRKDRCVKLHGHRIDPAEIDSVLRTIPEVRDVCTIVRKSENGDPRSLIVYVELRPGVRGLLPRHLQTILTRKLPAHMVPAQLIVLDQLPQLPNFKVDRVRLEQFDSERSVEVRCRSDDPLIDEVAQIYESVLRIRNVSPDDNVQSLGGDSLQAIDIQLELEQRFEVRFPEEMIEQRPSIRKIAQFLIARPAHVTNAGST